MYLLVVCWKTIDDGKKRTTTAGDLNYHADVQVKRVAQHPMSHIQRVTIGQAFTSYQLPPVAGHGY